MASGSNDPQLERIRPCVSCGGLIPFSAVSCHLCGAATEGAPQDGERVRSCLECGVIVRFDQNPCPECGAAARLESSQETERLKGCVACGAQLPFQDLYCGTCGHLSIDLEEDDLPPQFELNQPASVASRVPDWVAGGALGLGLVGLGFAGLRILL